MCSRAARLPPQGREGDYGRTSTMTLSCSCSCGQSQCEWFPSWTQTAPWQGAAGRSVTTSRSWTTHPAAASDTPTKAASRVVFRIGFVLQSLHQTWSLGAAGARWVLDSWRKELKTSSARWGVGGQRARLFRRRGCARGVAPYLPSFRRGRCLPPAKEVPRYAVSPLPKGASPKW